MKHRKLTAAFFMVVTLLVAVPSFATLNSSVVPSDAKSTKVVMDNAWGNEFSSNPEIKALNPDMLKMGLEQFLNLTPAKYKAMTGKKLGLKKSLELKAAQKFLKKKMSAGDADISKGVYILLAIFGLGWLAMGLLDDWSGSDWIVNLVLTFLCWLPGLIHALIKMKKYYN